MIAAATLVIVIILILLAARIATVALMATGMPLEVARFQARSALTGVGYTTGESESVVGHPLRRRIVMALMLVGNAGFVTIVASAMLSSVTAAGTGDALARLAIAIGGLLLIGVAMRSRRFEQRFTTVVARLVTRFSDLDLRDFHHIMQLSKDYTVTELAVRPDDWLAGKTLADLELPEEGVLVLAVQRADGEFHGAPRGQTVVHAYDTLVLYGRASVLSDLDKRPATPSGDQAHQRAVAEQEEIIAELGADDPD